MKKMSAMRRPTHGKAWNDLRNVHNRVLIPSSLLSSLTSLATRNNLKNPMEAVWSGFKEKITSTIMQIKYLTFIFSMARSTKDPTTMKKSNAFQGSLK